MFCLYWFEINIFGCSYMRVKIILRYYRYKCWQEISQIWIGNLIEFHWRLPEFFLFYLSPLGVSHLSNPNFSVSFVFQLASHFTSFEPCCLSRTPVQRAPLLWSCRLGRTRARHGGFSGHAMNAGDFMIGSCCALWDDLALIKPVTDPVSGCARRNLMAESFTQDLIDTF